MSDSDHESLQQRLFIYLIDGNRWSVSLDISDTAKVVETFQDTEVDVLSISVSDPERQWHLNKANIAGIEILNSEDVDVPTRTVRPSAKSRRKAPQR